MGFEKESDFEEAVIQKLIKFGWEDKVLKYPTEKNLVENWANILFENNRGKYQLNDCPLTDGEMNQILNEINNNKSPVMLNNFINGRSITIVRDNKKDTLNYGKNVSLHIYDRNEIAGGKSRYQIVQQPIFSKKNAILPDRRGDLMLLINGMPVFHIELKRSKVPLSEALIQIQKYAKEGVFTGIFSLIQIFVGMTPESTKYFANPGDGTFNPKFYFSWADFYNEPINEWDKVIEYLLSIPMAHMMIGFYTIADSADGILKVMRSYQYYAANKIADKVKNNDWNNKEQHGGYIWHTTGSGKTLTSFKSAQLIANSRDADKVIFLTDRIELGEQTFIAFSAFAGFFMDVQSTDDTVDLINKIKSDDSDNTLIVTSIQKMSNIKNDDWSAADIEKMRSKRIVIIIDEAHRDTFGDMLTIIKDSFPNALFFGFTGTPILPEHKKEGLTQADIFGDELHRYSIADGIRDENVLGFDLTKVATFKDSNIRKQIALKESNSKDTADAFSTSSKKDIFNHFMNDVPMAGIENDDGTYEKGIEDYIPKTQYTETEHQVAVAEDIIDRFEDLSQYYRYHAIFATSSINEAISYYRVFKSKNSKLNITCLFDPSIDNKEGFAYKEDGLVEIINDYNNLYNKKFSISTAAYFKTDIQNRLAHKDPYRILNKQKVSSERLDLLIVVDQMLTGYDSKWVNTLYIDKMLAYENIIQAFSRTNRINTDDKPFGIIRYYRKPHTMERNINTALKLFSGEKEFQLFVDKLDRNLKKINSVFETISNIFADDKIDDFDKLPLARVDKAMFAKEFRALTKYIRSAKLQGFKWNKSQYSFGETIIDVTITEQIYNTLLQRYKELSSGSFDHLNEISDDIPFDLDISILEMDTSKIDNDYMNSKFKKYVDILYSGADKNEVDNILAQLHKTFATLPQEEQKYAYIILHDIQDGSLRVVSGKTFKDYISEYISKNENDKINKLSLTFGLNEALLKELVESRPSSANINSNGKFDKLVNTVDETKAFNYLQTIDKFEEWELGIIIDDFLRKFILSGGFEL